MATVIAAIMKPTAIHEMNQHAGNGRSWRIAISFDFQRKNASKNIAAAATLENIARYET